MDNTDRSRRWEFTIPVEPPSLNALMSKGPLRFKYMRLRRDLQTVVELLRARHSIPQATVKRHVALTRLWSHGRGKRAYDMDNLIGGLKPFLDALKSAGIIVDDSPQWVAVTYHQRRSADGKGACLVILDELSKAKST